MIPGSQRSLRMISGAMKIFIRLGKLVSESTQPTKSFLGFHTSNTVEFEQLGYVVIVTFLL